jgi:putative ABC transport system permease protein
MPVLLWLYRQLLRVLPRPFRERQANELELVLQHALAEERQRGVLRVLGRFVREALDVLIVSVRVRFEGAPPKVAHREGEGDGMTGVLRSLRISARTLVRQPVFALTATLTLGAGVGCAAAAFGVLDTLLLQPLPHRAAKQLVMVWRDLSSMQMARAPMSYPTLIDVRAQTEDILVGLEASTWGGNALLQDGAEPELVNGARVTGGLFGLLGNAPQLGRVIQPADDAPGAEPVAVLSHALWLRYFRADRSVLGKLLEVRGARYRVVGVMGPEFVFPSSRAELWVPLRLDPAQQPRDVNYLMTVGRLKTNVTLQEVQARLDVVFSRLARAYPDVYDDGRLRTGSRHEFVVGDARRMVWLGAAAAALLLLIACANLGNLMLVRGLARGRELAVRSVLGATRARVAGELIAESVLIGAAGALLGVFLANSLTRVVVLLAPESLPRRLALGVDARVIAFASVCAILCALVCSLAPVLRRIEPRRSALATAGGSLTQGSRSLQGGLLAAQVSLALVLLVMAGLLTGTLARLLGVPVGFDGSRVLTVNLNLPPARYDSDARIGVFFDELFRRVSALPGVQSVGGTWALPFSQDYAASSFVPEGSTGRQGVLVASAPIRGDYFGAVGMRLMRGRNFDARDLPAATPVGIINETLARRFWPDQDPLGKRMVDPDDPDDALTVVGVVNDVYRRDLAVPVEPEVYMPHTQQTWDGNLSLTVRTTGDPLATSAAVRAQVHALDPLLPVARVATLAALVSRSVATQRFRAAISAALSLTAALLTLLGIYSVQAVFVSSCRRDLAVRLALGARPRRVTAEVVGRGLRITLIGITIGITLAAFATRGIRSQLFELSPLDPTTYITTVLLFVSAATLACWIPARRIGRIDPMLTLREE